MAFLSRKIYQALQKTKGGLSTAAAREMAMADPRIKRKLIPIEHVGHRIPKSAIPILKEIFRRS